jgi:hypothetical protein
MSGWNSLTPSAQADWKKNNFNLNVNVPQSQIDTLNSRKTPEGNFAYYKQHGANDVEREALNRFYGKSATDQALGTGVPAGGNPDNPNNREGRIVPDPMRPNAREDRPGSSLGPITHPGGDMWHNESPFGPRRPGVTPPAGGPSAPMPSRYPQGSRLGSAVQFNNTPSTPASPMPSRFPQGPRLGMASSRPLNPGPSANVREDRTGSRGYSLGGQLGTFANQHQSTGPTRTPVEQKLFNAADKFVANNPSMLPRNTRRGN